MDQDRWKKIKHIFHTALEVSTAERHAFVLSASNGDPGLQVEVELLLKADQEAGDYLESCSAVDNFAFNIPKLTSAAFPVFLPNQVVQGRFRIVRRLGGGGMGDVYEAFDLELSQAIALKTIRPEIAGNKEILSRFKKEVQLARRLNGPCVCRIHELFVLTNDQAVPAGAFFTMELLDGITLADRVKEQGPISWHETQAIATDICVGLSAIHEAGIVHRDLKSRNIMLADRNGSQRAVLMDFGLARELVPSGADDSGLTVPGAVVGTPEYMAPEQFEGKPVTPATDIYAIGVLLYELVTGKHPFAASSPLAAAVLRAKPPQAASSIQRGVPRRWDLVIRKCLEYDAGRRYQSANELAGALNRNGLGFHTVLVSSAKGQRAAEKSLFQKAQLWAVIALAAGIVAAAVAGRHYHYRAHQTRPLSDQDTVVLADFDNTTGEVVFDDALKTALTVALNQSTFLNVLPENKVSDTFKLMARPADTRLNPELARELCQRAGSKAVIEGSIARLGSQYLLGLKAVNCRTGELLAQEQVIADRRERVLDKLGRAASTMRGRLGESLSSIQKYDVPLVEATTASLDALKALSLGRKKYRENINDALARFQEATGKDGDPNFAMAYHDQGRVYFSRGEMESGRANFARAFALGSHLSEREKLEITATYYENVTGELGKALDKRTQQVESYPNVSESYDGAGYTCSLLGKYELAIDMLRKSIRLDPDSPDTYGLLANSLLALQRLDESRTILQQVHARNIDSLLVHTALYDLAFLRGDASAMTDEENRMRDKYENFSYALASDSEAYKGRQRNAWHLTQLAVDSNANSKETGAVWYENAALREAAFGDRAGAELAATSGLKMEPTGLGAGVEAALAYAIAGDNARADSLANSLSDRFPLDTQVQSLWLPAIRAQMALNRNDPPSAIDALRASARFELGQYPFNTYGSCLYTAYLRGEAYLADGQGEPAAGEFRKILDHSGLVGNCWTGALAHLGLARANSLQAANSQNEDVNAARMRALSAYKDFLNLWKDADDRIPVFREAKSEFAKLTRQISR